MKYSGIGGQAVIEGIMMMKGEDYAVAVRRPDKEIEVKKDTYQSITKKAKILQLPFVRGVFRFADSMIIGMRSLSYSASFFEDDEDAEPGKFEQLLDRVFGEKLESAIMAAVLVISFILAIGIFMLLPLGIANLFKGVITSDHLMAVLEGVIRIAIFIIYIKLVSRMEDIQAEGHLPGLSVPRGGAQVHQLCGTRTSADGKICARELEGAQALWYQFHIDCHGDQYSDVYGDPGRYDLDADAEPYYSGSGHCGYII